MVNHISHFVSPALALLTVGEGLVKAEVYFLCGIDYNDAATNCAINTACPNGVCSEQTCFAVPDDQCVGWTSVTPTAAPDLYICGVSYEDALSKCHSGDDACVGVTNTTAYCAATEADVARSCYTVPSKACSSYAPSSAPISGSLVATTVMSTGPISSLPPTVDRTTPNTSTAPTDAPTDPPTVAAMTPARTPVPTEETTDAPTPDTTAMNPCIICPNGVTAGYDDVAPWADDGDYTTCAQAIDAAKLFETGSKDCAWAEEIELACCPWTDPENLCIICPNGATAGDDYVPPYEGNDMTCTERIDYDKQFEAGSDHCGVIGELDASYCCPPVEPLTTWPSSGIRTITLFWVRVLSAVAGVCLLAIAVYYLHKRAAQVQGPATTGPAGVEQIPEGGIPTAVASKIDPEIADTPLFQLHPVLPPAYAPYSSASAPPLE